MKTPWLQHYPTNLAKEISSLDKNLVQLFCDSCKQFQNQTAFISQDTKLTYRELKKLAYNLAAYLQSQNLKPGDKILIQLPNILQYPISLWASLLAGLTIVNLNDLYRYEEMIGPIQDSNIKAAILTNTHIQDISRITSTHNIPTVIFTDPEDLLNNKNTTASSFQCSKKHSISFLQALKQGQQKKLSIPSSSLEDLVFIQYTGGTTGVSKGVCLNQKNILSNIKQCELWFLQDLKRGQEQALAALPISHIFALLINIFVFSLNGFSNLLTSNAGDSLKLIESLKKHPISTGTGVNTLFKNLLKHASFTQLSFSRWKLFITGGMALEASVRDRWQSVTNSLLIEGYGLTEASPVVCCNKLDSHSTQHGVGLPLPSTHVRVVDNKNQELPIGQEGELEVRGPQVMLKYYNQKQETQQVLSSSSWLKTGDIAKINQQGYVYIIDRKKDMINISGFKTYPKEVEDVLLLHNHVKACLVCGHITQDNTEAVKAFIVKQDASSLSVKDISLHCKKYLAYYKIPKYVKFVNKIPTNILGKSLRRLFKNKTV